jgi:energy-coupling factor transport system permease protein
MLLRIVVRRSRWLLLTLMLVYALTTPGEFMADWGRWTPTYEGVQQGLAQVARLLTMLAGLALLLGSTPRSVLMGGLCQMLRPLMALGVPVERFSARLWLTLHYVEEVPVDQAMTFRQRFDRLALVEESSAAAHVSIELVPLSMWDMACLTGLFVLCAGVLA